MFITPYFGGCKYTNNFLFINKNIEFQYFDLLISFCIFERCIDFSTMETDRKWVIVRIDGKIAAISQDYRLLAEISARLATQGTSKRNKEAANVPYQKITAEAVGFDEVWKLRLETSWDDLLLFGTEFQKKVWKRLFDLTHPENDSEKAARLISYSDFAGLCQNRAGVRAVAHAIGLNPISVIIPCHLVIPKESIDKMMEINRKAESTIFKGDDLCLNSILKEKGIDFGEYALGRKLKRELIQLELA